MFGLYGMSFMMLAMALTVVALLWKQRWSPYILAAGVALTALLVWAIFLDNHIASFMVTRINIYVVMFLAAMLLFAGGFGLAVRCIRWLASALSHRPKIS